MATNSSRSRRAPSPCRGRRRTAPQGSPPSTPPHRPCRANVAAPRAAEAQERGAARTAQIGPKRPRSGPRGRLASASVPALHHTMRRRAEADTAACRRRASTAARRAPGGGPVPEPRPPRALPAAFVEEGAAATAAAMGLTRGALWRRARVSPESLTRSDAGVEGKGSGVLVSLVFPYDYFQYKISSCFVCFSVFVSYFISMR